MSVRTTVTILDIDRFPRRAEVATVLLTQTGDGRPT